MRPGDDGYINVPEGKIMKTLEGHTNDVRCVIQLTDGRLASCCDDNTIKIWDTISGRCLMTLEGHTNYVPFVIQLTDGRLVSGSRDSTIKIWDTISGICLMTLEGHTDVVNCVTQLTDGRIVSCCDDDTLRIWNIMSLSQQKWVRRRLLVLLFEASKILSDPPEFDMINSEQYLRRRDLKLLLRCCLNISNINNNNKINLKAFKITLTVLSMPEIAMLIANYL